MRVLCRHGHFAFYPQAEDEVIRFRNLFKLQLYQEQDYFTLLGLRGLPRWSQTLRPYGPTLGIPVPAIVTYEGRHAHEVMKENGFVYSLMTGMLIPFVSVTNIVTLNQTLNCAVSPRPLIQAGSILPTGDRLLGYEGDLDLELQRLYIYAQETLVP